MGNCGVPREGGKKCDLRGGFRVSRRRKKLAIFLRPRGCVVNSRRQEARRVYYSRARGDDDDNCLERRAVGDKQFVAGCKNESKYIAKDGLERAIFVLARRLIAITVCARGIFYGVRRIRGCLTRRNLYIVHLLIRLVGTACER